MAATASPGRRPLIAMVCAHEAIDRLRAGRLDGRAVLVPD
jgi:hypothetical protein